MFSLLETKREIAEAQRKLETTMHREFSKKFVKDIGFPGGTLHNKTVFTNGRYWFCSRDHRESYVPNPRRLNWFGLFERDTDLEITVEINTVYDGRNDQVAGFFARDNNTGKIYLMHSGGVRGGTKGVSKFAFLAWSDQRLVEVADSSGKIREGVLVMPIEGKVASHSIKNYIDKIAEFKQVVRTITIDTPEFQHKRKAFENFYAESRGRRKGKRSGEIDYLSWHGDVVDALYSWRKSRTLSPNGRLVKNVLIDLGVTKNNELVEVFEVKTSTARSDVYGAIGQLMVHGTAKDCRRVIVLPHDESLAPDLKQALQRLGIELLRFRFDGDDVKIVQRK